MELADIAQQEDDSWLSQVVPEGVEAMVPYRGPAREVLAQLHRGIHLAEGFAHVKHVRIMSRL